MRGTTSERGQAHTLEGVLAALLLVVSVVFALQVSAVTPMSESTASQHIENQQAAVGENLLDAAIEDGTLKEAVLYWDEVESDENDGEYVGSHPDYPYYTNGLPGEHTEGKPDLDLGTRLNETLTERGIAYDLTVNYVADRPVGPDELDRLGSQAVVDQGEPSDHAITVTRLVTLYEDDELRGGDGPALSDADEFYVPNPDRYDDGPIYNVIEVELTLWRM